MAVSFPIKDSYTLDDLRRIVTILRAPDGCPWDREQTHQTLLTDLLEETYEALDAIRREDVADMREELGDVLLQLVFHSDIERERGTFTFDEVITDICRKLIVRHPHVFGDVRADTSGEVLQNWDAIKRQTKGDASRADLLRSLPASMPALMRAAKVQKRARRAGFDWPDVSGAWQALESETRELEQAMRDGDSAAVEEELGDLLFSAVNVSRFLSVDAEQALTGATEKFISRFEQMERLAGEKGVDMGAASLEQLDALWDEVKLRSRA
ncbi:MAG: nucleoside triphosphate pyrophosphohydrolase [Acutalibacteraceae bacterium]|jgi:tetrapyrrole methylase family protein/MazG family protein